MAPLEVPGADVLGELPLEICRHDEPWVTTVRAEASDGSSVELTWDVVAAAVGLRWTRGGAELVVIEREGATKVSVHSEDGGLTFRVWFASEGLGGQLFVGVGRGVVIRDALLRS